MNRIIASFGIGACLLLPSVVLAADPHTVTGTKGQPGTAPINGSNGIACGTNPIGVASAPGNGMVENAVNSPFGLSPPAYAGTSPNPTAAPNTNANTAHAVSEYDVACFQAP